MNTTLIDLFREQTEDFGDSTALVTSTGRLTFSQFDDVSFRLAAELRRVGAGPDICVGVIADSSVDLMAGAWGILRAGAAYVPLAPEYSDHRLRQMISETRTRIVFVQRELRERAVGVLPSGTTIVTLDDISPGAAVEPFSESVDPGNLAYVVFTSGSTGTPRGAMVDHRAIVSQLHWLRDECGIDRSAVVLQKTPASFDAAQWELLAIACGSAVVVGPSGRTDPERLIDAISAGDVTVLQCVPTLLRALLATGRMAECTSLRTIFSGGETLDSALANECVKTLPQCDLINLYGPSECTINSSAFTLGSIVRRPSVDAD